MSKPNIIIILLDQASHPFSWENEHIKQFRHSHLPNIEYIQNNSINLTNHHISSAACVPSRATLFTGMNSKKTRVFSTDGMSKTIDELTWIDPRITPSLGNILIDSGKYKPESVVYIGKHHLKKTELLDEEGNHIHTIDRAGTIIQKNLEMYQKHDMLRSLEFTLLSGHEPHGIDMRNAGFLVDKGYTQIAIDWLKKRKSNPDPFVMSLCLVEPHDLIYFPYIWRLWGNGIPKDKKPEINLIPSSPTDGEDISKYPIAYQNWVKRYDTYFTSQNSKAYRQFYYYLLTIADDNLGKFFDYFKTSSHADNTIIIFTSDHGDLCGAHGQGYQKWYIPFEEVTHVFCNIMRFKNKAPLWKGEISYLTSHIDICPTICTILGIQHNGFDGKNIFNKERCDKAITCHIQDHFTMGENLTRFVVRIFPALAKELACKFIPVDRNEANQIMYPEYAISIVWKFIDNTLYKLAIYHTPNNYDHSKLLSPNVFDNMINKGLVLLYDLTNDKCETRNIIEEKHEIAIMLCNELVNE